MIGYLEGTLKQLDATRTRLDNAATHPAAVGDDLSTF